MTANEVANRSAKAARLAQQLLAHGADLAAVEALPAAGWSMVAELAGDAPPSDLTKAAVIGLFRELDTALWPDPTDLVAPDHSPAVDPFAAFDTDMGVALDRAKTQARGGR